MRRFSTISRTRLTSGLKAFLQPFVLVIFAALIVRASFVQAFAIPTSSMTPTLEPGDFVVVTPFRGVFHGSHPRRGDVIVFRSPRDGSEHLIKRVVAIPGDMVEIRSGKVWVNARLVSDRGMTDHREALVDRDAQILPDGRYFVLGDHREDSVDSRAWGFLDERMILGKARVIFWSSFAVEGNSGGAVEEVRWNRILRPVR